MGKIICTRGFMSVPKYTLYGFVRATLKSIRLSFSNTTKVLIRVGSVDNSFLASRVLHDEAYPSGIVVVFCRNKVLVSDFIARGLPLLGFNEEYTITDEAVNKIVGKEVISLVDIKSEADRKIFSTLDKILGFVSDTDAYGACIGDMVVDVGEEMFGRG